MPRRPLRRPNLLVDGGLLEALGRVPPYADLLFAKVHRREGGAVRVSGLFLRGFGAAFERLALASLARDEVDRLKEAERPPASLLLRYHLAALFVHCAGAVSAAHDVAESFLGDDPRFEIEAARLVPGLLRIQRLGMEATLPARLRILPPERAAREHAASDEPAEIDEGGVAPGPRREWLPVPQVAAAVLADAALYVETVARSAMRRISEGTPLELDLAIESG